MRGEICIDGLKIRCMIGCLDIERTRPQVIQVDLSVNLDIQRAADSDDIRQTWNYAALTRQVSFILQAGRFHLLESAGRMLLRHLLLPPLPHESRPPILSARVSLTKFGVLPGEACPRLVLAADADTLTWSTRATSWGTIDTIDESRRLGLYRMTLAPGAALPRSPGAVLAITAGLHTARELDIGAHLEDPAPLRCGDAPASLLCLTLPPLSAARSNPR